MIGQHHIDLFETVRQGSVTTLDDSMVGGLIAFPSFHAAMAVVLTSALQGVQHASTTTRLGFIAATIFGCDLGPNLTTVGSLATILWLLILRRRNLEVSGLDYFKVGILVTPLMLLAGSLTIWLLLR